MMLNYLVIFIAGFLVSLGSIFVINKLKLKGKLSNQAGIPFIGGIGMGFSFMLVSIIGLIVLGYFSKSSFGMLLCSFIILTFGFIDDYRELSVSLKFIFQIIAAALLILFGIRTHIVFIGGFLNIIVTLIWIIGITNAFNHLDVMDGISAGTALIISIILFIFLIFGLNFEIALISVALAGSTLGFLIYNFPPAKIYMGNSGSHFLGFVLAAVAITISYASWDRKIALISPLLILGFPIFDTLFLILLRLSKKKLPFRKSNDHLVLKFLALGHSKRKAFFIMMFCNLFFVVCGIIIAKASNPLSSLILGLVVLFSTVLTIKMMKVSSDG